MCLLDFLSLRATQTSGDKPDGSPVIRSMRNIPEGPGDGLHPLGGDLERELGDLHLGALTQGTG